MYTYRDWQVFSSHNYVMKFIIEFEWGAIRAEKKNQKETAVK